MKQKKFNRLSAFIPVRNLRETLDFYRDVFGFSEEWDIGTDGGIRRDDMRVVFCEDPEYVREINNDIYKFTLLWFVDNVDEIYKEFTDERQIPIVYPIESKPWGIREFSICDNNGYLIRVSEGIME
jgi:catechol 2,3-dioxygenase-like lactoylglutathione lyase family enzyme